MLIILLFISLLIQGRSASPCRPCPPSSYSGGPTPCYNHGNCTAGACPEPPPGYSGPGYQPPGGNKTYCTRCSQGTYQDKSGATSCKLCYPGHGPNEFRDGCVRCNPGEVSSFELTKGVCISCWELHFGFRSSNNQSACIPCDQGMMSYDAKSCTVCSPGFYWNPKLKTCPIECPKGNFCTPARVPERNETYCSTCTACKPGSFQPNDGQYGCVLCPAGTFQDTWGSTVCKPCSKGYVQTEKGAVSCIPCPGGYYCPNSDTMKPCPKGKYCPSESTQPQTCAMMFDARPDLTPTCSFTLAFVGIIAIFIYRWQKSRHREIVEKELLVKAKKRRKDPVYLGL